jgi:hypothetical protein
MDQVRRLETQLSDLRDQHQLLSMDTERGAGDLGATGPAHRIHSIPSELINPSEVS